VIYLIIKYGANLLDCRSIFSDIELATHLIASEKFGELAVITCFTPLAASHNGGTDMQFAGEVENASLGYDFSFVPIYSRDQRFTGQSIGIVFYRKLGVLFRGWGQG